MLKVIIDQSNPCLALKDAGTELEDDFLDELFKVADLDQVRVIQIKNYLGWKHRS